MKSIRYALLIFAGLLPFAFVLSAQAQELPTPPRTIVDRLQYDSILSDYPTVTRAYYDDEIAVYFSEGIEPTDWMNDYIKEMWRYTQETYGSFGDPEIYDPRFYLVVHAKGGVRGPATVRTYQAEDGDYRNVMSLGSFSDWSEPSQFAYEVITHEMAHVVEFGGKNTWLSASFRFWGDGPWPEIFTYDVYRALGRDDWAQDWFERMMEKPGGNFLDEGSYYFFRDWFYPIYDQYGGTVLFDRYFILLAENFPTIDFGRKGEGSGPVYPERTNYGETLHFMSAAAGVNLRAQFEKAFGWSAQREAEFKQAQQDYPLPYEDAPDAPEPPSSEGQLVQAEDYSSMQGIQTEKTEDTGGGLNVGYIDQGDVLNYAGIQLSDSGQYTLAYRVSSRRGDSLEMSANGQNLGTVRIPETGGWQNWQTVTQSVSLDTGRYAFRILAQSGEWNINWWRISYTGQDNQNNARGDDAAGQRRALSKVAPEGQLPFQCRMALSPEEARAVPKPLLYPNPAHDLVRIESSDSEVRSVSVVVGQQSQRELPVMQQAGQSQINVSQLPSGTHLLLIERADGSKDYQRPHKK